MVSTHNLSMLLLRLLITELGDIINSLIKLALWLPLNITYKSG